MVHSFLYSSAEMDILFVICTYRKNSNRNGFFQTDIVRVQTEEVFSKQKSFEFKQKWFFPNRHRSSSNRRGFFQTEIVRIQTEMVFSKQTSFEFKQKRFFPNRNRSNSNRNGFFQTDIVRVQTEEVFSKQTSFIHFALQQYKWKIRTSINGSFVSLFISRNGYFICYMYI